MALFPADIEHRLNKDRADIDDGCELVAAAQRTGHAHDARPGWLDTRLGTDVTEIPRRLPA